MGAEHTDGVEVRGTGYVVGQNRGQILTPPHVEGGPSLGHVSEQPKALGSSFIRRI